MFKKIAAHLQRGQYGERIAAKHLKQHGLQIIANNFRTRYGEIDLIAQDGELLIFIEVRTRQDGACVSAAESITPDKRNKWWRSAQSYLQQHFRQPPACRFDAICITVTEKNRPSIDWIRDVM